MSAKHLKLSQNHMATTFDFVISCGETRLVAAREVLLQGHRLVSQLEAELTEFIDESPIATINRSLPGTRIKVTQSAIDLFVLSERLRMATQGAFHCCAKSAPLSDASFSWDAQSMTAWRNTKATHIGFGAIGKGYALDRVRELIEQAGFQDYFLSGGGSSLIICGFCAPKVAWKWGWSWQKAQNADPLGISFSHEGGASVAIGVSGLHEKGFHIIDPRNNEKAQTARSALVALPSAAEADALSTALFVGGWEEETKHFAKLPTLPAMAVIDNDSKPRWNGTFQKLWGSVSSFVPIVCLFFWSSLLLADDSVDLGGTADVFAPYTFDRNYWFTLLPLAALGLVLLHLQKLNSRPQTQPHQTEETHET